MDSRQGLVKCSESLAVAVACPRQLGTELEPPVKVQKLGWVVRKVAGIQGK